LAQTDPSGFFHLRPVAAAAASDQAPLRLSAPGSTGDPSQLAPGPSAPPVQKLPEPPGQPSERATLLPAPTPLPTEVPLIAAPAPSLGESTCPTDNWVSGRSWISADSLIWWTSRAPLAMPLLTTGTATSQPLGTVGASSTTILFR